MAEKKRTAMTVMICAGAAILAFGYFSTRPVRWARHLRTASIVECIAVSPNGESVASWSKDDGLTIRELSSLDATAVSIATGQVNVMAFSPDGQFLATGGEDSVIWILDSVTLARVTELRGHGGPIQGLAISPDGNALASCGEDAERDGEVILWDIPSGTKTAHIVKTGSPVGAVIYSRDGARLYSLSGNLVERDVTSGQAIRRISPGSGLRFLDQSGDGRLLAFPSSSSRPSRGSTVTVVSAESGDVRAMFSSRGPDAAFSPVGSLLAIAKNRGQAMLDIPGRLLFGSGEVLLVDVEKPTKVWSLNHSGPVYDVAFSADGSELITAGSTDDGDGMIRIYEIESVMR